MKHFKLSAISLLLAGSFTCAHADDEITQIEEVVITATRTPQQLNNVLSDVTVITQEDIQKSGSTSLEGLLNRTVGIQATSSGGKGKSVNLLIRGTASNQSVILVDGVRQMQATGGQVNLQYIPLDQIERIEIVRGSASSLYGADAMGGVIQIFTKKPTDGHHQSAGFGFGSDNASEANIGATGRVGSLGYQLNVTYEDTKGFSATNRQNIFSYNPDNDGYRNTTVTAKLDYEWLPGQNLRASVYQGQGNNEFDENPALQDEYDFKLRQLSLESANTLIEEKLFSTLKYSEFEDRSDISNPGALSFPGFPAVNKTQINTKIKSASWVLNVKPADKLNLLLGFDWKEDRIDVQPTRYSETSRENKAVFIGADWQIQKHLLEGSARFDDNEQFGNKTTGRLAYGYKFTPQLTAKASYATGFRAPTFADLYYPSSAFFGGNPDLKPEESHNTEMGLTYNHPKLNASWVLFQNKIKNNITNTGKTMENVDKVQIRGSSVSVSVPVTDKFIARFDATYQDPVNKTEDKILHRRARAFGTAGFDFMPHEDWTFNASMSVRGKTYDDVKNTDKLSGYASLNLGVRYQITPTISTSFTVENLFDKEYTESRGYNTPGQSVFWRVNYQN